MSENLFTALLCLASFAATLVATRIALAVLAAKGVLDRPNERSSHARPTPRGGGIAVIAVLAVAWGVVSAGAPGSFSSGTIVVVALGLALVSWRDDLGGLGIGVRLGSQIGAIVLVFSLAPEPGGLFAGVLPPVLDLVATGLAWLWFINLYNFMDGIDAITGTQTASIGAGLVALAGVGLASFALGQLGAALIGVSLGFLVWNWPPARIFLGDVGSVPLGFLVGWLLIQLAGEGAWAAAVILPLYYLGDATLTLVRRIMAKKPFWRAHREHFYQRAAAASGHVRVVWQILV
ncbi:MAG: MraY family glycosyltransferase, partial [Alphaproteobacteria bacterium]